MKYDLDIRPSNIEPHVDIENDIQTIKNGLMTFTLRVNSGNIVDYVRMEVVNGTEYLRLKSIVIEEYRTTSDNRK